MLFDQSKQNRDQQLVASSVYDQNKDYIGVIVRVNRDSDGQLSLLVRDDQAPAESTLVNIDGAAIQEVNLRQKQVYVDLAQHPPTVVEVDSLPLRQEELTVNRNRQKVGEISVRKTTNVHTVEVPVRSEKLVIENVDTGETLTEVGLSDTHVTQEDGLDVYLPSGHGKNTLVRGHLANLKDAINFLEAVSQFPENGFRQGKVTLTLARHQHTETATLMFDWATTALQTLTCLSNMMANRCEGVDIELLVGNRNRAATYQSWLSRYLRPGDRVPSQTVRLPNQLQS